MKSTMSPRTVIDGYIEGFSSDVQARLVTLRTTVRRQAPDAVEKISYRMPTFYLSGNVVHFAAFDHHIGFYPTPSGITAFGGELAGYKSSKGAVQFPHNEALPLELIARIVAFRVAECVQKGAKRRRP